MRHFDDFQTLCFDTISTHTILKVKFFVQKFNFDKTPTFSRVFHPKVFWQFFSWNQSCQQLKSPKAQHFHEFFTQKIDNFLGQSKLNFRTKNEDFEQCVHKRHTAMFRALRSAFFLAAIFFSVILFSMTASSSLVKGRKVGRLLSDSFSAWFSDMVGTSSGSGSRYHLQKRQWQHCYVQVELVFHSRTEEQDFHYIRKPCKKGEEKEAKKKKKKKRRSHLEPTLPALRSQQSS